LDQPAVSRSDHPRGPQVEERRSELSCECQFLIGSYIFPEDLRDPESSTCPADLSIPVDSGRPLSRCTVDVALLDVHHTAEVKEMSQ